MFYDPFFFPGNFAEKCYFWSSFFLSIFWSLNMAKKIRNFLKCCKSNNNTTLPFIPYAKIGYSYECCFEKWHSPLNFSLLLSLLPTSITFPAPFLPYLRDLLGFFLVRHVFGKTFSIIKLFWRKSTWEMKLLENILVFVSAVFELFQKFRNCLRKSTKLKMMLWYVSVYLSTHPPTYATSTK